MQAEVNNYDYLYSSYDPTYGLAVRGPLCLGTGFEEEGLGYQRQEYIIVVVCICFNAFEIENWYAGCDERARLGSQRCYAVLPGVPGKKRGLAGGPIAGAKN